MFIAALSGYAQAPAPEGPNAKVAPNVAILAGRLIDVRSGRVTTSAYIVVEKDRIARIVSTAPAGMKVIDLSKYTVFPA